MKYCRAFSQGCIQSKIHCFTVVKFACVRTVQCTHFICIYVECTPKDAQLQYMAAYTLSLLRMLRSYRVASQHSVEQCCNTTIN